MLRAAQEPTGLYWDKATREPASQDLREALALLVDLVGSNRVSPRVRSELAYVIGLIRAS